MILSQSKLLLYFSLIIGACATTSLRGTKAGTLGLLQRVLTESEVDEEEGEEGEEEEEGEGGEEEEEISGHSLTAWVTLFLLLTFLVIVTIIFEKGKEAILESANARMRPVVETLFSEMTVLGFISLVTFAITACGVTESLSASIFGESEEGKEYLQELLEQVHYALFLVMVIFIMQVLVLVRFGNISEKNWDAANAEVQKKDVMEKMEKEIITLRERCGGNWNRLSKADFARKEKIVHRLEFKTMRQEFLSIRSFSPPFEIEKQVLNDDFDYGKYLAYNLSRAMIEIVEVPPPTWFALWSCIAVFFIVGSFLTENYSYALLFLWLAIGYLSAFLFFLFKQKIWQIRERMIIRSSAYPWMKEELAGATDAESLLQSGSIDKPLWTTLPDLTRMTRKRSWLEKKLCGRAPNRQMRMYWFGEYGPETNLELLRFTILGQSIYITVFALQFIAIAYKQYGVTGLVLYLILTMIPLYYIYSNIIVLIRRTVHVGCVGCLRKADIVGQVIREQKTARAVKSLLILNQMRMKLNSGAFDIDNVADAIKAGASAAHVQNKSFESDDNEAGKAGGGRRGSVIKPPMSRAEVVAKFKEEEPEKHDEICATFEAYDEDGSGEIEAHELKALLNSLGYIMEREQQLEVVMNILDEDQDGTISKNEFVGWYVQQMHYSETEELSTEELVEEMFNMFDKDGSGEISVQEFHDALNALKCELTLDEVTELVRELDEDHDGTISKHEFANLLEKHANSGLA